MKILVTGCGGQLGCEIQSIIAKGESEIGNIPAEFENCEVIAVDVDRLDITDVKAVSAFVSEKRPDVIINCAGFTDVNGCETKQQAAFAVNAVGTRNLAMAAEKVGAKFIHISTDYVFSGDKQGDYNEWDMVNPQSIYGKTKQLGERYAIDFCQRTFVVRTAWLYGYIGKNFVKTMRNLGRTKKQITVVNDQFGNPTNANDLVHHILKLAVTEEYGIYHCTGKGKCSWFDFATEIMKLSDLECEVIPCTTEEYPTPAKRPANSSLSHTALELAVGDEMRDWKTAIKEYISKVED